MQISPTRLLHICVWIGIVYSSSPFHSRRGDKSSDLCVCNYA